MKTFYKALMLNALLVIPAFAGDPFMNPSGIVNMPTAYVENPGAMSLSYNSAGVLTDPQKWSAKYDQNISNLSAHFVPYANLQVGVSTVVDQARVLNVGADVHYQMLEERAGQPAVAAGGLQIGTTTQQAYYLVASKHLTPDFQASLGIGMGDYFETSGRTRYAQGLMAGVSQKLGNLNLMAEFDGRGFQAGATYQLNKGLQLNFAAADLENLRNRDSRPANLQNPRIVFGLTANESFLDKPLVKNIMPTDYFASKEVSSTSVAPQIVQVKANNDDVVKKLDQLIQAVNNKPAASNTTTIVRSQDTTKAPSVSANEFANWYEVEGLSVAVKGDNEASVSYKGKEILTVYNDKVAPKTVYYLTPSERAQVIKNRLATLIVNKTLSKIQVKAVNDYYAGVANDTMVFSVTRGDSMGNGMNALELAKKWAERINAVFGSQMVASN